MSAVTPFQAILHMPSTCRTCHTDAASATSFPGSQVVFKISVSDYQSPESDTGTSVCSNKNYYLSFFFNLQAYLKHVPCLWMFTRYLVFWFFDLTFLFLCCSC